MSDQADSSAVAAAARPGARARSIDPQAAVRILAHRDPQLGALIRRIGPFHPRATPDPFNALLGSILHQQISMRAAAAVQRKLRDLCGGQRFQPEAILQLSTAKLRSAGLSRQKTTYVRDLAEHFASGRLSARRLRQTDDEAVIEAVTQVKGVGRWTAEMLLIFCLRRPDVWPIDDYGLRKAAGNFLRLGGLPDAETMRMIGNPWRPFRTVACWYLWRSLENPITPGISL